MKNNQPTIEQQRLEAQAQVKKTGIYGGLILLNGLGVRFVRTIVQMAKLGSILRMTSHVFAPIAGMRTDWAESVIKSSACASHWRSGMVAIPFSRTRFGLTGNEGNHGEDVKEAYFTWTLRLLTAICITVTNIPKVHFPTINWSRKTAVGTNKSHPFN